jgi:hypothetical protein
MSDVITSLLIQIKADATQAIQALKNIAMGTTQVSQAAASASASASAVSNALTQTGQAAEKASGHIRGLTYYFRSGMDSMRFALMGGGNPMAAFYALDEGIRAAVASGMEIGTLVPVIGGVLAALGTGAYAWHEWNEGEREAAKNAKDLAEAWKGLPGIITQLNEMQEAGLLTAKQVGEYADVASGRKKMYWDEDRHPTASPSSVVKSGGQYIFSPEGVPIKTPAETRTVQNTQMTREEQQQWAMDQATAGGTVSTEYLDAVKEAKELIEKANDEALSGLEKQKAEIRDKYNDELKQMKENLSVLTANMSDAQISQSKLVQNLRQAMTEKVLAEQQAIKVAEQAAAAEQLKKAQDAVDQIAEQQRKQQEADKQHEAELQRQAQLTRDIQRSAIENQIESVKSNALMTDQQKLQIVSALQQKQVQINDTEIAELEALKAQVKSVADQLELEKKIADLKHQNQKISDQPTPQQDSSFSFQFGKALVDQQNKWTTWAQESAKSFQSAWNGATNAVSAGFTHLFEYGAQKGQWFREMWNGVVGSLISSFTQMAVSWVMNHVIMEGVSIAFYAVMRSLGLADVAAKILGDNMKLISHIFGETTATTVTTTQATTRIAAHAAAAGAGAAESVASIPFVGWVLALGVAAALVAGVLALAHGFSGGGYTGDGPSSQIAGVVHAGEYVIPASRVNANTMGLLHNLCVAAHKLCYVERRFMLSE